MTIDALLSTIILVGFVVTVVMAIGSYLVYRLRESRRPRQNDPARGGESPYFERIEADEVRSDRGEGPPP